MVGVWLIVAHDRLAKLSNVSSPHSHPLGFCAELPGDSSKPLDSISELGK